MPTKRIAPSLQAQLPAAVTGLVYVNDEMPGITRIRNGRSFRYRDAQGQWIRDPEEIARIRKLAIPPAYTDVWICPRPDGHIQATGVDARGRKQYRYHPEWSAQRNENKFERMEAFGRALPRIRARVARDLVPARGQPPGRRLVLATLVRLLDTTFVRVGNDEYAKQNGSYGLTTLCNPHARVRGSVLQLHFRGKSGVMHEVSLDDPQVALVVRQCQQLPGQDLFQYVDENGQTHAIGSGDVNDYLAEIAGERFTAKDFRTWHGTVQALELTRLMCCSEGGESYSLKRILAPVSKLLGNTPAVCRKSYIHPAVIEFGQTVSSDPVTMAEIWQRLAGPQKARRLHAAEARLLAFLKARHARVRKAGKRNVAGAVGRGRKGRAPEAFSARSAI
jgi:DNA topoisomerase-1